ncbi:hypothetical protein GOODEAATRI_020558 [Goodea atripinnis]|uniref:Uncharacterized protein n=1 Tax=Goodea atripinnis TaxID=208336 RepID=A0ABV0NC83_9TELE
MASCCQQPKRKSPESCDCVVKYRRGPAVDAAELISKQHISVSRQESELLVLWCISHNLLISVTKPKEMVVDFRTRGLSSSEEKLRRQTVALVCHRRLHFDKT